MAGVDNNIKTPGTGGGAGGSSNSTGTNTVTNYEISKKVVSQKDNNFTSIKRITAAVTFDSSILKDITNKDEFISSLESVVQDTIGYDRTRGDKVTVKDFKFIGVKPIEQVSQTVDENGNAVIVDNKSADTLSMIRSLLKDFSEYIQYIIAALLLFVFYKKFIASNEVVILGDGTTREKGSGSNGGSGSLNDED